LDTNSYILTIAGHDPSAGAGLTADLKTFEAHGLYGLSVCTAITVQNDINFKQCIWTPKAVIIAQIETLFERFKIPVVKIGIVESWQVLNAILECLHALNSEIKVVLDPVIKTTSGFDFHSTENQDILNNVLKKCYIITPNYIEIEQLYPNLNIQDTLDYMSNLTNVYLKGGHRSDKKGWDALYHNKIVMVNIPPISNTVTNKHGSGCVLASALASQIVLQEHLEDAARSAKHYIEQYLNSNTTLLGKHTYQNTNNNL